VRILVVAAVTAACVLCERRGGPVTRGATALVLGIVGTVAPGVTITLSGLVRSRPVRSRKAATASRSGMILGAGT
jgi:hypothetical protein